MTQPDQGAMPQAQAGPVGIGGWLILPIIGLVITPLRGLLSLPASYSGLGEVMPLLTGAQKAFILFEIAFNTVILMVLPVLLLILLAGKKRSFARWFIFWAVFGLVGMLLDLMLARMLFPEAYPDQASLFDQDTLREFVRSLVLVVIWVPYMLRSRRVANTFIS